MAMPAFRLSYMLNPTEAINGVLTFDALWYFFPSSSVIVALGESPFMDAEKLMVLSINAIPAGLKNMLSDSSFWATPVCPIPPCFALRVLTWYPSAHAAVKAAMAATDRINFFILLLCFVFSPQGGWLNVAAKIV